MKRKRCAAALGVALQRQHVAVAVDDAGGGREEGGRAFQIGLERHRLGRAHEPHALHAVGFGAPLDLGELLALGFVGGDDQLAAIEMRHAVRLAVGIEKPPTGHAGARHQAPLGIVDAGMDHFGIARRGLGADRLGGLDDDDLTAGKGEGPRYREPHDAGADHDAIDAFERGRTHGAHARDSTVTRPVRRMSFRRPDRSRAKRGAAEGPPHRMSATGVARSDERSSKTLADEKQSMCRGNSRVIPRGARDPSLALRKIPRCARDDTALLRSATPVALIAFRTAGFQPAHERAGSARSA